MAGSVNQESIGIGMVTARFRTVNGGTTAIEPAVSAIGNATIPRGSKSSYRITFNKAGKVVKNRQRSYINAHSGHSLTKLSGALGVLQTSVADKIATQMCHRLVASLISSNLAIR